MNIQSNPSTTLDKRYSLIVVVAHCASNIIFDSYATITILAEFADGTKRNVVSRKVEFLPHTINILDQDIVQRFIPLEKQHNEAHPICDLFATISLFKMSLSTPIYTQIQKTSIDNMNYYNFHVIRVDDAI